LGRLDWASIGAHDDPSPVAVKAVLNGPDGYGVQIPGGPTRRLLYKKADSNVGLYPLPCRKRALHFSPRRNLLLRLGNVVRHTAAPVGLARLPVIWSERQFAQAGARQGGGELVGRDPLGPHERLQGLANRRGGGRQWRLAYGVQVPGWLPALCHGGDCRGSMVYKSRVSRVF
jgi:hypothetical protein